MDEILLFDRDTIDQFQWPNSAEATFAKAHLLPLIKEGTQAYIKNVDTELFIIKLNDHIIPITVNEAEYQNCYLVSSFFIAANLQEKQEERRDIKTLITKPFVSLFAKLLKAVKINKVVIINNWLFSTNPYPELTANQIQMLTAFLKGKFPDHYLMFRSVNNYKSGQVFDALHHSFYRMIPCRHIYLYDPKQTASLSSSVIRKQKKDSNRIVNKKYTVENVTALNQAEIGRLLELYRNIYVDKYTRYSPIYTEKFLLSGLKNQIFRLKLLKKEGIIYGVTGFIEKDGYLFVPFFGYDTTVPQEEGLYRMLSAIIMQEIESCQLVSHQGSGAGQFKKWRGFFQETEYVGIYDRHLSLPRKLFWILSQKFSPHFIEEAPCAAAREEAS